MSKSATKTIADWKFKNEHFSLENSYEIEMLRLPKQISPLVTKYYFQRLKVERKFPMSLLGKWKIIDETSHILAGQDDENINDNKIYETLNTMKTGTFKLAIEKYGMPQP